MRFHDVFCEIAGSNSKARVLQTLLDLPAKNWTGRQLALQARTSQSQANKALGKLREYGIVRSARAGAAVVWSVNSNHLLVPWLTSIASVSRHLPVLLVERLGECVDLSKIEKVVLFGSVARGNERPTSDIDLLIVVKDPKDKEEVKNKVLALSVELLELFGGNPLMPVVYSMKEAREKGDSAFMKNVKKEGLVLHHG